MTCFSDDDSEDGREHLTLFTDENGFIFSFPYMRTLKHGNLFPELATEYILSEKRAWKVRETQEKKRIVLFTALF